MYGRLDSTGQDIENLNRYEYGEDIGRLTPVYLDGRLKETYKRRSRVYNLRKKIKTSKNGSTKLMEQFNEVMMEKIKILRIIANEHIIPYG